MPRPPEPFTIKKRVYQTKEGQKVVWLYTINETSGLPKEICQEHQRRTSGKPTKKKAIEYTVKLIERLKEQYQGGGASGVLLEEYAEPFYDWDRCPHIASLQAENKVIGKSHAARCRKILQDRILTDEIAKLPMNRIRRGNVIDFRNRIAQKFSPRVTNITVGVLKTILREAYFREDIPRNPADGVGNIQYKQKERGIFKEQELKSLFEKSAIWSEYDAYALFLFLATTGTRMGEARALRFKNVYQEEGRWFAAILEAVKPDDSIGKPKWERTRTVPLTSLMVDAIRRIRDERIHVGDEDYVFQLKDNGYPAPRFMVARRFNSALDKVGIDKQERNLVPHSFRHTLHTLLLHEGADVVLLREFFGWSDRSIQSPVLTPVQGGYTHIEAKDLAVLTPMIERLFL